MELFSVYPTEVRHQPGALVCTQYTLSGIFSLTSIHELP